MLPHDALEWRIDASLLTHLRTIRLRYHVQLQNEWLTKSSPRRWTQLLYFLEHFSSTSVECIILDVHIICTSRYASPLTTDGRRRALALLSWPELGVALQSFKKLKKVHVRLRILGNIERSFAVKYLELVATGLGRFKTEGRAVFDWVYYNETERRFDEFGLP